MNERLLQFIWQFQYFNKNDLFTEDGASLHIIQSGQYNTNQGPDFLEAIIKVDTTTLAGTIELHVKSSDWNRHGHDGDRNYKNVILHVVWVHDDPKSVPGVAVLELQQRTSSLLLNRYNDWMEQPAFVPCGKGFIEVSDLVSVSWKDRLLSERLQRKTSYIMTLLQAAGQHWEEVCWQLVARSFGMQLNADAFENIARSLPVSLLARHRSRVIVLEALLQGQAGLLDGEFTDDYPRMLQREYRFYQHKHQLIRPPGTTYFLRMRPAAFPGIRLAQLAALVSEQGQLFARIKAAGAVTDLHALLNVAANDYWHYRYRFDEPAAYRVKKLGAAMVHHIIVNALAPIVFAYGDYHQDPPLKQKALRWLSETVAERNNIMRGWQQLGVEVRQASDSQALLELKHFYCDKKRCLDCAVGTALLKRSV